MFFLPVFKETTEWAVTSQFTVSSLQSVWLRVVAAEQFTSSLSPANHAV